ncbi:hypothetical protein Lalb_Chr07g0194211 [Lupinus albus]|uniref:Uncharacterized protein n=1 Tax=Lupinus albus TaxID=3870 RepID=A0A6A4QBG4_LUPAL|nr:hypothetical protein Lalb_Chr07g0194211 [Lupinus albus]
MISLNNFVSHLIPCSPRTFQTSIDILSSPIALSFFIFFTASFTSNTQIL